MAKGFGKLLEFIIEEAIYGQYC